MCENMLCLRHLIMLHTKAKFGSPSLAPNLLRPSEQRPMNSSLLQIYSVAKYRVGCSRCMYMFLMCHTEGVVIKYGNSVVLVDLEVVEGGGSIGGSKGVLGTPTLSRSNFFHFRIRFRQES